MRIVVLWSRFGPYHLARLHGLAQVARKQAHHVVGLEIARTDHYAWEATANVQEHFERVTLFREPYSAVAWPSIAYGVWHALDFRRPDVVAINGWATTEALAALAWAKARGRVRVVLMSETKEDDRRDRSRAKRLAKAAIVRRCDAAVVGGQAQRAYLVKLGMPADRIWLGYDAVDNDHFSLGAERARSNASFLRKALSLPRRYFFACARFIPRKNIVGLVRAYGDYHRSAGSRAWGLVVAGGTPTDLGAHFSVETAGSGLIFPGFVQYDQLPSYYGLASAFVHPALSEPWGLVVNEAAASRLPLLLSTATGAGHELLRAGHNGHSFDPTSRDAITRTLMELAGLPEGTLDAMGLRSQAIVRGWSPERFGDALLAAAAS